jgi:hypothetical protein
LPCGLPNTAGMAMREHLLTKRARTVRDIAAVRAAAASLSKLLAEDVLVGDAWERAVLLLARYRTERTRLNNELRTIDSAIRSIHPCQPRPRATDHRVSAMDDLALLRATRARS